MPGGLSGEGGGGGGAMIAFGIDPDINRIVSYR